ncbi:MAG: 2-phosphosulfolactate phosphatase [Arachidicoccus sp.]|nr:2-phosphosulfolactate phosphatase [Arachidicoccus sp.]
MEKPQLHTILTPKLLDLYDAENSIVVIIDVFRATSTIATALYNGAKEIYPVADVQECILLGKNLNAITAGERDGKVIEGLQFGNSPTEYSQDVIENKILVITTTNGTKMLQMALDQNADSIITGSFPNLGAVCEYLISQNKNVLLGCSGWKDRFNLEDVLFAGAVVSKVSEHFTIHCDSSLMAKELYELHQKDIKQFIRKTTHWHRLEAYGLEKDLEYCVTENAANVLPLYNKEKRALLIHR